MVHYKFSLRNLPLNYSRMLRLSKKKKKKKTRKKVDPNQTPLYVMSDQDLPDGPNYVRFNLSVRYGIYDEEKKKKKKNLQPTMDNPGFYIHFFLHKFVCSVFRSSLFVSLFPIWLHPYKPEYISAVYFEACSHLCLN